MNERVQRALEETRDQCDRNIESLRSTIEKNDRQIETFLSSNDNHRAEIVDNERAREEAIALLKEAT